MSEDELCLRSACELAGLLRRREVSAREVLRAHLARIDAVNPKVNAIVTVAREHAHRAAHAADQAIMSGEPLGPLHGLPVAHKDLTETKGIRTTYGSPARAEYVPDFDSIVVERLTSAGAVTVGKTNTPEWGTGSQTFNPLFGATRNPYDLSKTVGGSSGGAAAALAARLVPIADGTDMGGSLRNPASFCNVVGLRPSLGRVPMWPAADPLFTLGVAGPMARTAADVALLMRVLAEPDPRSPLSHHVPASRFADPLDRDFAGTSVAWSADLGGLPVDERVLRAMAPGRQVLAELGCRVTDQNPDLTGAEDAFRTWRAWYYALSLGPLYREHPEWFGDSAAWNIEAGWQVTGEDLARAQKRRIALYHRMREFLDVHEFLVTLVSPVPPFDVELPYPPEVAGVESESYLDWMRSCYWISATGLPAASVPCGFTDDGLPVGLQIVGRPGDDFGVLQLAHAFETATGTGNRVPALPDDPADSHRSRP
ncbi:amidase [Saccharomonospora xinjiangensis]|uniref:amidase n=1 Tax=Saccharomonospora xinjiangensis TaxID=75294 RepID=UPI0010700D3C|nr:amidase [Saccharomonospora xinjiangensis]QBQ61008.1 Acylamidase [Saccharomonospora xinjiangensis]